jgi:hypothetical protein
MFSSKWSLPGFERAAKRARGEEEGKIPAAPMPFARVRPGWTGKTKDQVIAKLNFIPEEVRETPRPSLEVPRKYEAGAIAERRAKKAQNCAIYAPGAAPVRPQLPRSGLSMPLPPPLMGENFGRPTVTVTDHINGFVEYKYENGSYRESLSQQSNAGLGIMAATRPVATPSRKRSAPADEAESGSSSATPPPPALGAKRQRQARPEIRPVATMYEQANYNGRLKDQAAVQNDVAVDHGEALESDDDDGSHGGVKLETR